MSDFIDILLFIFAWHSVNIIILMSAPSVKQQLINELFSKENWSPEEYIKLLSSHDLIEFLTVEEFCSRIETKLGEEDSKKFVKKFSEDAEKNQQQHQTFRFPFPLSPQSDSTFERIKLQAFVDSYVGPYQQKDKEEAETPQTFTETTKEASEFYYFDFSPPADNYETQQLVNSKEGKENNKKEKPKTQKKKNASSYAGPAFFVNCQKGLNELLQLNLTDYFPTQLNQVKNAVMEQINHSDFLVNTYQAYLVEYLQIDCIRSQQCNVGIGGDLEQLKQKIDNYFHEYLHEKNKIIQYIPTINESFLLKTWKIIKENQQSNMQEKTKSIKKKVKQILINGMKEIYLTFQLNSRIYAHLNQSKYVFININHKGNLSFENYRKDPMKSYISLCIFHELGHYVVRNYEDCPLGSNDSSFSCEIQTIGNKILDNMQEYAKNRPKEYFMNKNQFTKDYLAEGFILSTLAVQIYQTMEKHKNLFDALKDHTNDFKALVKKYQLIHSTADAVLRNISLSKDSPWHKIYVYIDDMLKSKKQRPTTRCKKKQEEYTFFFAIFHMEKIVCKWLKLLRQNADTYRRYKEKLATADILCYYIRQNEIIKEVVQQINTTKILQPFPQNAEIADLNQILRKNKDPLTHLDAEINSFLKVIGIQKILQFQKDFLSMQEDVIAIFPCFSRQNATNSIFAALLQVTKFHSKVMQLAKQSEVFAISLQLPSMQTADTAGTLKNKVFESGFILEKMLFPFFGGDKIYGKDFELMKNIEANSRHIGQTPINREDRLQYIFVARGGRPQEPYVDVSSAFGCGINQKRLRKQGITEESWRKEMQQKMV